MTSPYADAREWARDQSLANTPRLARLEAFAFQQHPEIVAGFGPDGASLAARWKPRSVVRSGAGIAFALLGIAGLIAPLAGVALYATGLSMFALVDPLPPEIAVPGAGICFAVAVVAQLVLWFAWLREGATWSPGTLTMTAAAAVMAGFAAIGLPRIAADRDYDLGGWLWPIIATFVVATALTAAILLRRGHRVAVVEEPVPSAPTLSNRERGRMLARELPELERTRIRAERDDALRILRERGLLDEDTLARALAADLGTLFTMDPIGRDAT